MGGAALLRGWVYSLGQGLDVISNDLAARGTGDKSDNQG